MYEQIARNKRKTVVYIAIFFAVWLGIGAIIGAILGGSAPDVRPAIVAGMVVTGILALCGVLFSLTAGASLVLAISGAKKADPVQYRELHNIVEALAIGDGVPKPEVYVIEDPSPNAFATGTSPKRAAITATTGLLDLMNREELEGVIGHEMSHISNYDVRLILIVSTLIGLAGLIASVVWRIGFFADDDDSRAGLVFIALGVLFSIVAFIVGPLIKLALSRRRESLADASGVELTRNPRGLINALRKLQENEVPLTKYNHTTAAMYIEDPLQYRKSFFSKLFDTHPPLEDRIRALEEIESGTSI
jgi:heat shock protein HtpX